MLWVITAICKPNIDAVREPARHAHKVYMDDKLNEGFLVFSGTALDHDKKTRIGSVFIVNVDTYEQARAFYEAEPFSKAGVNESVTIIAAKKSRWNPAAAASAEGRGDSPE